MTQKADYGRVIDSLWSIQLECDAYRYGRQAYDIRLDHIWELADEARNILLAPNGSSGAV